MDAPSGISLAGSPVLPNIEYVLTCGSESWNLVPCDEMVVNIISNPIVAGGYVTGTFSGTLYAGIDEPGDDGYTVSGEFRVKIDDLVNMGSISGETWYDLDGDNTQSAGDATINDITMLLISEDGGDIYGRRTKKTLGGQYTFQHVLVGSYQVRAYVPFGDQVVALGVGGEDVDNDFEILANNQFLTQTITINGDEDIMDIDLGLEAPTSINCSDFFSSTCLPDLKLLMSASGGVKPLTATLSSQGSVLEVGTFDSNTIVFSLSEGGFYEVEVEDAIGNKCTVSGNVVEYNNLVRGTVWRENENSPNDDRYCLLYTSPSPRDS